MIKIEESMIKIGVVSDTHLGSQLQQITLLRESYKQMKGFT